MTYPAVTKFAIVLTSAALSALPVFAKDKDNAGGNAVAVDMANVEVCGGLRDGVDELVCKCPSDFQASGVWGSGPYTADSNICSAALHSGLLSFSDTVVQVVRRGGQSSYAGSVNNGVTTSNWGTYGSSFDVYSIAATTGNSGGGNGLDECGIMPEGVENIVCSCPSGGTNATIWGSDPYTADSDICTAARHAGVLDASGGEVIVLRLQGLETYIGSGLNGVTTSSWGSYSSSITFDWN